MTAAQKALKAALQPFVEALLRLEHDAASIDAQIGGIPTNVPRNEGPEKLLEAAQGKLDRTFEILTGWKPDPFISHGDCRDLLNRTASVAKALGVEIVVAPLPRKAQTPWTADPSFYEQSNVSREVGGMRLPPRYRFEPGRELAIASDGSLLKRKR